MSGYIEGVDRKQETLFPERLEDWIGEDHPVRVIDVFVDALDLAGSGFNRIAPAQTGRPGYDPAVLLKLFIYGYMNRVTSSRRLEKEAGRNVEVMWLTGRLVPDHKTIADFRKDNGPAIRKACARFVELCRQIGVLASGTVAIDGSKMKAVNNRDRNFTSGKVKLRISHLEQSAARYLEEMDRTDRQETSGTKLRKVERLKEKLSRLRHEVQRLQGIANRLEDTPDGQISLTDPDARSMATYGKGTGLVGYNVQTAVDTATHLIVAHDVTNVVHDRAQLAPMAKMAKQALQAEKLNAIADRGYFNSAELLACDEDGITATVPRPETSGNRKKGMFVKADFFYDADSDTYTCPSGKVLTYRYTREENGLMHRRYWHNDCQFCPMKARCTTGKERRITRWEHEHLIETMYQRMEETPDLMRTRRCTVEHPFGTIKAAMGATHFQMRRLKNVRTEMALHVLAYNIKRVMNMIGARLLVKEILA
ncbi:IS1182 family transposase [Roseibium algicola]|uniref:IS1182 family transposase n=1 Tax=Roseibium algicola TaxID=2857014 RepID=A0ABM6HXT5_9HYPH|nr:IS1182 family transposase [Roseibium aggregatum]AQQ02875.1 IS1182 family transposase [Roseibium aggregatum]